MRWDSPFVLIRSQIWQTYSQNTTVFIIAPGGTLAINSYLFRPLYWQSLGCTPSCYKVTIQYTICLLLMMRSHSQNFSVAWTYINSSDTVALDNNVQSNAAWLQLGCGPGPMCVVPSRGVHWIPCMLHFSIMRW